MGETHENVVSTLIMFCSFVDLSAELKESESVRAALVAQIDAMQTALAQARRPIR